MKMTAVINGREHKSLDKPKMKHLRIGAKLMAMQENAEGGAAHEYIDEIYGYIKLTFPDVGDEDIDGMETEQFMKLAGDISRWANANPGQAQKKN